MPSDHSLSFQKEIIIAKFVAPSGEDVEQRIEVRINPVSGRSSRIAVGRRGQKEPGTDSLPLPPPDADDTAGCPFCRPQVVARTPRIRSDIFPDGRLCYKDSILFPNLFPYGGYSAVSLFDSRHFAEIGTASVSSYADCFINCRNYLRRVLEHDSKALYMAITQNHLPSAGGSLIHPHLQINADGIAPNHHRFLRKRAEEYFEQNGSRLFSDCLLHEKQGGSRYVGKTGSAENERMSLQK